MASNSLAQILERDVFADVRAGLKLDAFGPHLLQAPVENVLLHLEVGNAVAQQAADAVGLLEHRDRVAGAMPAAARRPSPAGPEPTTATRLPVRFGGGSGVIQPSFKA